MEEECVLNPNATATTDELFASWKAWTEKWGEYMGTKRRFSEDLSKRGFKRWKSGSRGFQGITIQGREIQEGML